MEVPLPLASMGGGAGGWGGGGEEESAKFMLELGESQDRLTPLRGTGTKNIGTRQRNHS